jgi:hypothetical protein
MKRGPLKSSVMLYRMGKDSWAIIPFYGNGTHAKTFTKAKDAKTYARKNDWKVVRAFEYDTPRTKATP